MEYNNSMIANFNNLAAIQQHLYSSFNYGASAFASVANGTARNVAGPGYFTPVIIVPQYPNDYQLLLNQRVVIK